MKRFIIFLGLIFSIFSCNSISRPDSMIARFVLPVTYLTGPTFKFAQLPTDRDVKFYFIEKDEFFSSICGEKVFKELLSINTSNFTKIGNVMVFDYAVPLEFNNKELVVVALIVLDPKYFESGSYDLNGKIFSDIPPLLKAGKIVIGYSYESTFLDPSTTFKAGEVYPFVLTGFLPEMKPEIIKAGRTTKENLSIISNQGKIKRASAYRDARLFFGEYMLINNQWNYERARYALFTEIYLKEDNVFGWRWSCKKGHEVYAYPEVYFGYTPWQLTSTTSRLPIKIGSKRVTVNFKFETAATGVYDTSFDIWLSRGVNPFPGFISHEIMIWLERKGLLFFPPGKIIDRVKIGNVTYDVYLNPSHSSYTSYTWCFITFLPDHSIKEGSIDISLFFDYLLERQIISTNLFLISVEFGNEVVAGEGITEVSKYDIKIE